MQRLENVPPEQMNEVIRVATELHEQDLEAEERRAEAADHARSTAAAAEEVGLPRQYLEQAAEVVQKRRIATVVRRRKQRRTVAAVVAVASLSLYLGLRSFLFPLQEIKVPITQQSAWIDKNAETKASISFETTGGKQAAVLKVEEFQPRQNGVAWANLNIPAPTTNLSGYKTIRFSAKRDRLEHLRLYLENPTERWRSRDVQVSRVWGEYVLKLSDFEHQTRTDPSGSWRTLDKSAPGKVERFSFKVGDYVNPRGSKGEVAIADVTVNPTEEASDLIQR